MTNASENSAAENGVPAAPKGARPSHRLWLVRGEGKEAVWTEITALWPTKSGNGYTAVADTLLPIMANHMKGRLVVLPARSKPENNAEAGAQ